MAVVQNRDVRDGLFTPFHTEGRGGTNGLVGTLNVDALATGDSGGGGVTVTLSMRREEFGFPLLWVPTIINSKDNLASAEAVLYTYTFAGNRRLAGPLEEGVLAVAAGGVNTAVMTNVSVPIEGDTLLGGIVMSLFWGTNTDTKSYHLHMFGPVYDLQVIARLGDIDPLAAGLR